MDGLVIRAMRAEDSAEVSRVQCDSFTFGAERAGFDAGRIDAYCRERGSDEAIRDQLHAQDCFVACRGSTVVGVVGIDGSEIAKLFVDPSHSREGIGGALFNAASDAIAQAGHGELRLRTIFLETLPFYRAMGMTELERRTVDHGPMAGAESIVLGKPLAGLGA